VTTGPISKLATAVALGSALVLFAACGVTKSSFECSNANCDVSLSGSGSDAELESLGITIVLERVEGDQVSLSVVTEAGGPDEVVEVSEGETVEVLGNSLTVETVDGDDIDLNVQPG